MIQIRALSDSYDLLMGAAQKLNPHQRSFNMNYGGASKKTKCFCKYMIRMLLNAMEFDVPCFICIVLRQHYNVLLSVPRCEIYLKRCV